jgi:hypothetical protein
MKIGKFRIVQSSRGYDSLKGFRPGDKYSETRVARYNNNYFPLMNEDEYLRRKNRRKERRGKPIQWFEKYAGKGIKNMHACMHTDNLT